MLNEVVLHGELGERFGGPYKIAESSVAGVVRNLCGNFPEIRKMLRDGSWYIRRVFNGIVINCDESMLTFEMKNAPIHIYPAVSGAGGGNDGAAVGKIILGSLLLGAALLIPGMQMFGAIGLSSIVPGSFGMLTYGSLGMLGLGIALGGIAMLISPGPTSSSGSSTGTTAAVVAEGDCVPLVFGTFMATGKAIASQSITNQVQVGALNYHWYDQGGTNPIYVAGNTTSYNPLYSG